MDPKKKENILLFSLSNLGDIILTTPVFSRLTEEFPEAVFDIVSGENGREIFAGHPSVRRVVTMSGHRTIHGRIEFLKTLRGRKYDMVVDLKNTLMPFFVRCPVEYKVRSLLNMFTPKRNAIHKKDEHLAKLTGFGIETRDARFIAPVSSADTAYVDSMLGDIDGKKIVVISPGSKSHLKRWDCSKYAGVSDILIADHGCVVALIGNPDDKDVIDCFRRLIKYPVVNMMNKTSISQLFALIKKADMVITNDSAPLHVASAVNTPVLAIFGPTDERKYGPLSAKNSVLKPDKNCRPCEKALCSEGPDEGCIGEISAEEVLKAAKELLGI